MPQQKGVRWQDLKIHVTDWFIQVRVVVWWSYVQGVESLILINYSQKFLRHGPLCAHNYFLF